MKLTSAGGSFFVGGCVLIGGGAGVSGIVVGFGAAFAIVGITLITIGFIKKEGKQE